LAKAEALLVPFEEGRRRLAVACLDPYTSVGREAAQGGAQDRCSNPVITTEAACESFAVRIGLTFVGSISWDFDAGTLPTQGCYVEKVWPKYTLAHGVVRFGSGGSVEQMAGPVANARRDSRFSEQQLSNYVNSDPHCLLLSNQAKLEEKLESNHAAILYELVHVVNYLQLKFSGPTTPVVAMAYTAGKDYPGSTAVVTGTATVIPGVTYHVKTEILRNDLGSSHEKVSSIRVDGYELGECNPDGGDYDCTFFDCFSAQSHTVTATSTQLQFALSYQGHSWDCDCDTTTWESGDTSCSKESTIAGRSPMAAVARFTLTVAVAQQ